MASGTDASETTLPATPTLVRLVECGVGVSSCMELGGRPVTSRGVLPMLRIQGLSSGALGSNVDSTLTLYPMLRMNKISLADALLMRGWSPSLASLSEMAIMNSWRSEKSLSLRRWRGW